MFWKVCARWGILFILNSFKYLTKQLCPCHFNFFRPFLSRLVKGLKKPVGRALRMLHGSGNDTTGVPGSLLQRSYVCLCFSLFLPDCALYCSHTQNSHECQYSELLKLSLLYLLCIPLSLTTLPRTLKHFNCSFSISSISISENGN